MSEFIAEATVLVRPDTTKFRAALVAEVTAASKGVVVPITVVPVVTGSTTAIAEQTSQVRGATDATREKTQAELEGAKATREAERLNAANARTLGQVEKGALAAAAGMTGLRGAVLAASGPFLAATVAAVAFGKSIGAAASLERELNVFRVTAGATAEQMERVSETAKSLGRDLSLPGVTAQDAASTFLTLSKAGLSLQDSLEGARGTLQLAVAAEISFADAAQLTASALNAFALQGEQAVQVADLLTNAANASQASIGEMGIALRQSAAIADLAGFSLSETVTFLTQLARAGLAGSDAGTSFRVSIQRLIAPTAAAQKELSKLKVDLRDAQENLRPEAFFELGEALQRMGRAQADASRQIIFGNDASRAAAFFARINAEAFREQERALQKQGAAAEVAGAKNAGFAGKTENLKNQVTALGIEIGELSLPALGVTVDATALFFGALANQISDTRKEFAGFEEDADKLQEAFNEIVSESGVGDFFADAARQAKTFGDALDRITGADDVFDFFQGAEPAATSVHKLTEEERRLAEQARDAHHNLEVLNEEMENTETAAQKAAGAVGRLTGQIAGLREGVIRARISGDQGTELDLLQQERERLQRLLAIQENIVAQGGRGAATARRKIREEILPQLESVTNEIEAIAQEQVAESKRVADAAENARDERDRNILAALGAEEGRRQNAVIRAEATASLKDDLQANIALRNFYRASIVEIRKTVKDAQERSRAIAAATADLIRAQADVAASRAALKEAARAERREERERVRESLALDIQIAQATGNQQKEIQAREKEIEFIKKQIRQTRRGSNQRKRLILELRQAEKELRELQAAKEKTNGAASSFFQFLQTQQGFAANLLGNLIPGFATGGLVGGSAQPTARQPVDLGGRPQQAVESSAALGAARERGVRPVQVDTTNQLLRQILAALQGKHTTPPEAAHNRRVSNALLDTMK